MMTKAQWEAFEKAMRDAGMFAEPSAVQKVMSVLQGAPEVAARLLTYLAAKQELKEMKNELNRLQGCVRELEAILEQQGPAACARSNTKHMFVNWTVSFAESYYGLAMALQAKKEMITRVQAYLNGQHQKSGVFRLLDQLASQPLQESPMEKVVRELLEKSTKNVPGFLKP